MKEILVQAVDDNGKYIDTCMAGSACKRNPDQSSSSGSETNQTTPSTPTVNVRILNCSACKDKIKPHLVLTKPASCGVFLATCDSIV